MGFNMTITGQLVNLRPIDEGDTDLIVKWRNNPSVRKNFIFREIFTSEMHQKWFKEKVLTGEVIQYIIETKDGLPVGSVYFRDVDRKKSRAEYGIFIGEDSARGKGIGSESAVLFTDYGNMIGLKNIILRVLAGNTAAERSYIKAGFIPVSKEKINTSDGELVDIIIMEKKYD